MLAWICKPMVATPNMLSFLWKRSHHMLIMASPLWLNPWLMFIGMLPHCMCCYGGFLVPNSEQLL